MRRLSPCFDRKYYNRTQGSSKPVEEFEDLRASRHINVYVFCGVSNWHIVGSLACGIRRLREPVLELKISQYEFKSYYNLANCQTRHVKS